MNGYVCFYKSMRVEVHADTSYQAQLKAQQVLKVKDKQRPNITVLLAEKNSEQVTHNTAII